jgi:competence protein ComEC
MSGPGTEETRDPPADLRLVPPALAAWATAAVTLTAPTGWTVLVAAGCGVVGAGLLIAGRARPPSGEVQPPSGDGRPEVAARWRGPSVAVLLLCVAAAATSAGLHGADVRRGPVPELAGRHAAVRAEVEITGDARLSRARGGAERPLPPTVLVEAEVVRLTTTDGRETRGRTPVLLMADGAEKGARAGEQEVGGWLGVLPSTRVRVRGRLAPALVGGGRVAAVLRVGRTGKSAAAPQVVGGPSGVQRTAGALRAGLREATGGLDEDARALLPGLVVGDTVRVTPELHAAFEETDLLHLMAVSGANFTILLALLIGPAGIAQRAERGGLAPRVGLPLRATAVLSGVLTAGFVVVCRPEPSVLRAASCGLVALLAIATGRRRSLIPALATAVLLLVLYDPWLGRSYGFLLSVLATGALLTLAPRWSEALRARGVPARIAEALAAAGAAQAVCAPVVAVLAARVSLVAVPCNLLAEFAVAPATVLGFGALAAAPWAMPVAKCLAWCASWPAGWIADLARAGAALPGGGIDWPGGWRGGALLALATGVLVVLGRRAARSPWVLGGCVLLLILYVVQPPPLTRVLTGWPPPGWRLVMCDVGQGDALVLAAGPDTGVVVDAGPDPVLVDRCLSSLGITRVPLLLLTHFHADHVAGLPGVLRGRAVGEIGTTGFGEPVDQAAFVRRVAAEHRIPVTRSVAGERRRAGPLEWRVLWPPAGAGPAPDGPNDASVTLLVRTAGLTLLLLGDLEPPAQRALLRTPPGVPRVDVLKVAHHGSAYQEPELLRRAAPRLALVSVGADNTYGHPAPRTVAALRALGATVLRTDRGGSVAVVGGGRGGLGVARSGWK